MALLCAADDNIEIVHASEGGFHGFQVAIVERLEAAYEKSDPHSCFVFGGLPRRYLRKRSTRVAPHILTTPTPEPPRLEALQVDGSFGEGGGQILRTAVLFSIVAHRPIRVFRIRAGREVPGLRAQHVAVLEILRDISGGNLEGATVGSGEISFSPGDGYRGSLQVDLKTAASVTLVLQAVVPAVSLSASSLNLALTGGTDVPWSPSFDYFAKVLREGFRMAGIEFEVKASRRGYYPRGGGKATCVIRPCPEVNALRLSSRPGDHPVAITSRCGRLPAHVSARQALSATEALRSEGIQVGEVTSSVEDADSPGSSVLLCEVADGCLMGTDALGAKGRPADEVGEDAARRFAAQMRTGACIDVNLADMLAPVVALSETESLLRVPAVTEHLTTSLHVARLFTSCDYSFTKDGAATLLSIRPGHDRR